MARAGRRQQCSAAGVTLVLLQLAAHVAGHGLLLQPRSRNWLAYLSSNNYWSHGLNAGGVNVVSNKGKLKWPHGRHGLCGDSYNEKKWDVPGEVQQTYISGQEITIDTMIAVNHLGRLDMQICDLDAKGLKQCKDLQRADGKGRHWYLPFIANWTGGNAGYVQPAYGDGSFSWYYMPSVRAEQGCKTQRECDQFRDMIVYRTKWRLPAGFECRHCKLQWHYMTASTCWPPCPEKNKGEPTCENKQVFLTCGTGWAQYPEEFWNCADVSIAGATNRAATSNDKPVWEDKVSLKSGKFGSPRTFVMGVYNRRRLQQTKRRLLSWLTMRNR
ncbi:hypothetical protein OEZ85_004308 [Tetradesmus obliquus]|uniref:Chitin-binding type-4 domain-containing protein n=1 Tax=Tetradesmus obliquus TaxID=3088 RepID=A0ABY8UL20_TETOB|nr:hypothetical protein OEZ85_004308 [Tetradesmus obliquus]